MRYSALLSQPEIHFALERAAESRTELAGAQGHGRGDAGTPRPHLLPKVCVGHH